LIDEERIQKRDREMF